MSEILDITGVSFWVDSQGNVCNTRYRPDSHGTVFANGGCRVWFQKALPTNTRLWEWRRYLSQFGTIKSIQVRGPKDKSYLNIVFYNKDCRVMIRPGDRVPIGQEFFTVDKVENFDTVDKSWGVFGNELMAATMVCRYNGSKCQTPDGIKRLPVAKIVYESIDTRPIDYFCYRRELNPSFSYHCAVIVNDSSGVVEIYTNIKIKRRTVVTQNGNRTYQPSSPVKFVLRFSQLVEPKVCLAPFKQDLSELDIPRFGLYVGYRHSAQIFREPTADDDIMVKEISVFEEATSLPAEQEWIETIVHPRWSTEGLSMSKADSFVVELALTSIFRQWGLLLVTDNAVIGRQTAMEHVETLLAQSGLAPSFNHRRRWPITAFQLTPYWPRDYTSNAESTQQMRNYYTKYFERRGYLCWGALVSLISSGILPEYLFVSYENQGKADWGVPGILLNTAKYDDGMVFYALRRLRHTCHNRNGAIEGSNLFRSFLSAAQRARASLPVVKGTHCLTFHFYVSPSKVFVDGPYNEVKNRMLRQYTGQEDNFARATFVNHMREEIYFNETQAIRLAEKMRLVFARGLWMGHRNYKFLSYGNSQLRSKSFWTIHASTRQLDPSRVLKTFGTWDMREPGKKAARQGQCLSSTIRVLTLDESEFQVKELDVRTRALPAEVSKTQETTYFTWTDGVGYTSYRLMVRVATELGLSYVPSCIQFRFGGAKGVLSVYDEGFRKCHGSLCLKIRESQNKFNANAHTDLEVCDQAMNRPFQFNKQMILLMDTLGCPQQPFQVLIENDVAIMKSIFNSRGQAMRFLSVCNSLSDYIPYIARFLAAGFHPDKDLFIRQCLEHLRLWFWNDHLLDFRIPNKKGATLFGIFDERRLLRYCNGQGLPQVFIQVTPRREGFSEEKQLLSSALNDNVEEVAWEDTEYQIEYSRSGRVITGIVMVTRSPALHPGDIILCEAVNVPQLRDLYDVIVFPGPPGKQEVHPRHPGSPLANPNHLECRDVPNMLGGGDLDGDQYQILWDPDFVDPLYKKFMEQSTCRYPAASFYIPGWDESKTSDCQKVRKGETSDFFALYQMGTNLGLIANRWLAYAHQPEIYEAHPPKHKAASDECQELAALHSKAVDFAKTGIPAHIPQRLKIKSYPHFMKVPGGKHHREYFKSDSLLGRIYDTLNEVDPRDEWGQMRTGAVATCQCSLVGYTYLREKTSRTKTAQVLAFMADNKCYAFNTDSVVDNCAIVEGHRNPMAERPNSPLNGTLRFIWKLEWINVGSQDTDGMDGLKIVMNCTSAGRRNDPRAVYRTWQVVEVTLAAATDTWSLRPDQQEGALRYEIRSLSEDVKRHMVIFTACPVFFDGRDLRWPLEFKYMVSMCQGFDACLISQTPTLRLVWHDFWRAYEGGIPSIRVLSHCRTPPLNTVQDIDTSPTNDDCDELPPDVETNIALRREVARLYERYTREVAALTDSNRRVDTSQYVAHITTYSFFDHFFSNKLVAVRLVAFLCALAARAPSLKSIPPHKVVRLAIEFGALLKYFSVCNVNGTLIKTGIPEFYIYNTPAHGVIEDLSFLEGSGWQNARLLLMKPEHIVIPPQPALSIRDIEVLVKAAKYTADDLMKYSSAFFRFPLSPNWCLPLDIELVQLPTPLFCPIEFKDRVKAYLWLPTYTNCFPDSDSDLPQSPVSFFRRDMRTKRFLLTKSSIVALAIPRLLPRMAHFLKVSSATLKALNPQFDLYDPQYAESENNVKAFCTLTKKILGFGLRRELLHRDFAKHLTFAVKLKDYFTGEATNNMKSLGLIPHTQEIAFITGCVGRGSTSSNESKTEIEKLKLALEHFRDVIEAKSVATDLKAAASTAGALENQGLVGPSSLASQDELLARASAAYVATALNLSSRAGASPFIFYVPKGHSPKSLSGLRHQVAKHLRHPRDSEPSFESFPYFVYGPFLCHMMESFQRWAERTLSMMRVKEAMFRRLTRLIETNQMSTLLEQSDDHLMEAPTIGLDDKMRVTIKTLADATVVNPLRSIHHVSVDNLMMWSPFLEEELTAASAAETASPETLSEIDEEDQPTLEDDLLGVSVVQNALEELRIQKDNLQKILRVKDFMAATTVTPLGAC
eukprot:Blabericola_migrator_1__2491@NODE_16_length_23467_cov_90_205256_g13_i0_p1_GENE_NODE_16_length_23467_cov_90_205256_g13_i0NODE_16_length_23467_cov_90_205256_g13_i0_p1_ORF_typecomplete_len2094_score425_63RdRP/PF05183_12/7_9e119Thioredoxin/PF00085_20/0_2_NODE_16_length_23467_cov_90_205256_g13_i0932915610